MGFDGPGLTFNTRVDLTMMRPAPDRRQLPLSTVRPVQGTVSRDGWRQAEAGRSRRRRSTCVGPVFGTKAGSRQVSALLSICHLLWSQALMQEALGRGSSEPSGGDHAKRTRREVRERDRGNAHSFLLITHEFSCSRSFACWTAQRDASLHWL